MALPVNILDLLNKQKVESNSKKDGTPQKYTAQFVLLPTILII